MNPRISELYIAVFNFCNTFQEAQCYWRSESSSPTCRLSAEIC